MVRTTAVGCLWLALLAGCVDDAFPVADGGLDLGLADSSGSTSDLGRSDSSVIPDANINCPSLRILTINGSALSNIAKLTSALDLDRETPGIQLTIEVAADGVTDGTELALHVTGLATNPHSPMHSGKATFTAVSVDPSLGIVEVQPLYGGCVGPSSSFNVQPDPTCSFVQPTANTTLTVSQDRIKNPDNGIFDGTFNYDVILDTTNAVPKGDVTLRVGSASQGSVSVDAGQRARFSVVLSPGSNVLTATVRAGEISTSCQTLVTVNVSGPACNITGFTPAATVTTLGLGLGQQQDANAELQDGIQTTLTVATDATADRVTLYQAGAVVGELSPTVDHAAFPLSLTEQRPYFFRARCLDLETGNSSESPSTRLLVDTTAPPAIADLACSVTNNRLGEVTCRWTAVSDEQSSVERYRLRYRVNSNINAANFDDAASISFTPDPPGTTSGPRQLVISGLAMPNRYSFALKAIDLLGNTSAISNVPPSVALDFNVQALLGPAGSKFGIPTVVGDFNCDQLTDLAVGLFDATVDGKAKTGEVYLYFSSPTGFPSSFSKRIQGSTAGGQFGINMAVLNFNGDNCADLAVASVEDATRGRAYLYLGRRVWTDRTTEAESTGAEIIYHQSASAPAESALAVGLAAEDLDNDGRDDLALSQQLRIAPFSASVLIDYGEANVPLMQAGVNPTQRELPAQAELIVSGGLQTARFGSFMGRGGLLNTDAYGDLLIGSTFFAVDTVRRGAAYVLLGAARSTASTAEVLDLNANPASTRLIRITGTQAQGNSLFGRSLAGLGDIDGDGGNEFAISDSLADGSAGAVYIFNLRSALPSTTADARAVIRNDFSTTTNNFFGIWLANGVEASGNRGTDLNGDGLADLLVGMNRSGAEALGSARVFYGRTLFSHRGATSADLVLSPSSGGTTTYGNPSVFLGDINGDGAADILVGETGYNVNQGRILLYY